MLLLQEGFFSLIERFSSNKCVLHELALPSWLLGWGLNPSAARGHPQLWRGCSGMLEQ